MNRGGLMQRAADTPGTCILIFSILISMFALGLSIAAATTASQTREYFCVDLISTPGDLSTATVQFHLDTHALTYSLRYRPENPLAQLTSLQILNRGVLSTELCSGSGCADNEQNTCSALTESTHCGALTGELLDSVLARDMRRNPLLYSWHIVTTDTDLYSISMGYLCAFF